MPLFLTQARRTAPKHSVLQLSAPRRLLHVAPWLLAMWALVFWALLTP